MEQKRKSGIYRILNRITNESYVGSSINIKYRWRRHRKDLVGNKHHSLFLQRSFNKYGEDSFIFSILEECEIIDLAEKENHWFEIIKPIYNICPKAYSQVGRKLSDEHKEKLRAYAKSNGIKPPKSTYEFRKRKIIMLDKHTLAEIKEFDSISEACVFLGKTHYFVSMLTQVCNGKRKSAFGYKWKFK